MSQIIFVLHHKGKNILK